VRIKVCFFERGAKCSLRFADDFLRHGELVSDSQKIISTSKKSVGEALIVISTRKNIILLFQKSVSKAGIIISSVEKIIAVLEKIFRLPQKSVGETQKRF
jgi:hypothetical protein